MLVAIGLDVETWDVSTPCRSVVVGVDCCFFMKSSKGRGVRLKTVEGGPRFAKPGKSALCLRHSPSLPTCRMARLLPGLDALSNGSKVIQKGVYLTRSRNEDPLGAEVS